MRMYTHFLQLCSLVLLLLLLSRLLRLSSAVINLVGYLGTPYSLNTPTTHNKHSLVVAQNHVDAYNVIISE